MKIALSHAMVVSVAALVDIMDALCLQQMCRTVSVPHVFWP